MGSFDGAEVCKLVGIYMLCFLAKLINKNDCGLYRDEGLLILRNVNGQQIDQMRKNIIKIFKVTDFAIDVETSLKIVDFLDIAFNLQTHIDPTKSQTIYYHILINLQFISHKLLINYQKQSMNVYPEIAPMRKSLIHLNLNTKKPLEIVDTLISN